MDNKYRTKMEELARKNNDIFFMSDTELSMTNTAEMDINIWDWLFKKQNHTTPLGSREIIEKAIKDMLAAGQHRGHGWLESACKIMVGVRVLVKKIRCFTEVLLWLLCTEQSDSS